MQKRLTKKQKVFLDLLEQNAGLVKPTVDKVPNMSRSTHYRWQRESEVYKQRVLDIQEGTVDYTEGQMFKRIKEGDTTAIIFHLKTKGRERGYEQVYTHNVKAVVSKDTDTLEAIEAKIAEYEALLKGG
jgi:hypothetical protein